MIRAKPQLNGNTRQDFQQAYVAISDAMRAIDHAAGILRAEITNGRNYQHLGVAGFDVAIADKRRVNDHVQKARALLNELASDIVDTLEDAA
jgi:hypothetical protein